MRLREVVQPLISKARGTQCENCLSRRQLQVECVAPLEVLAAQFESFRHPLVIMFTVPLAITGALLGLWAYGGSINVYSQIGLIMLVGLAAKNGVLIVEFANQLRDRGLEFNQAVIEAAAIRLRPVLMTSACTAIGALPLLLASGAGAAAGALGRSGGRGHLTTSTRRVASLTIQRLLSRFAINDELSMSSRKTVEPIALALELTRKCSPTVSRIPRYTTRYQGNLCKASKKHR